MEKDPIIGLGNSEKLIVQKSLPLFALWKSDLTLAEFKIVDTYLSRINSHKPECRQVIFEKGELERILGVKRIRNDELKIRLKHLMGNVVEIPDSAEGFRLVTLFEEAEASLDENGIWKISLECTQKAMKYFFNIENLGYLRYKLRCITNINSRYTYIMFTYLEHNRFRKTWEIELNELKNMLNCDNVETYKAFKEFNKQVLKKAHAELHEKTECRYKYEPVKRGRRVVAIKFMLETLSDVFDITPTPIEEFSTTRTYKNKFGVIYQWMSVFWDEKDFNLTEEQIEELAIHIALLPKHKLPPDPNLPDSIEFRELHYIAVKVAEIKRRDKEERIKNKYLYLLTMIKKDLEI